MDIWLKSRASVNVGGNSPASRTTVHTISEMMGCVTGWQDIDGKHLYFTDTGIYASNGIYSINGKTIYLKKDN